MIQFNDKSTIARDGKIEKRQWKFGDGEESGNKDPQHVYKSAGRYTVRLLIASDAGCKDTMEKKNYVWAYPEPESEFLAVPAYTTIELPEIEFKNRTRNLTEEMKYTWNFGDYKIPGGGKSSEVNSTHTYSDTGLYTIQLISENKHGCKDTMKKPAYVEIDPAILVYIPNAFSPNGDGKNDIFRVTASGFIEFEVIIYNRWGEELYRSDEYETHGWDGTFQGRQVPEGVYIYLLKATSLKGNEYEYTGNITLLR